MLIGTEIADGDSSTCPPCVAEISHQAAGGLILSHERIDFPSFPYEWPPEMLYQAGSLTLEIADSILHEGFGLKDATPYNILFRGPTPVFVDLLSFERRDAADPRWLPLAQFERTFLLPLLANKFFGLRLDNALLGSRDGLEPQEVFRFLTLRQKARPLFLSHVCMPTWLAGRAGKNSSTLYQKKLLRDSERALFIIGSLFARLRKALDKVRPKERKASPWSRYMDRDCSYSPAQFAVKEAFLREVMVERSPRRVLDVGCNTGYFSVLAAKSGARVVSVDRDPVVVGTLWRKARVDRLDILPLVVDIARPSPAMGWLNLECSSFLQRAHGFFDMVIALALLHHVLVNERVPLSQVLQLFAGLTRNLLVIEFISPQDPMFRHISRGRDSLYGDLTKAAFEAESSEQFDILRAVRVADSDRWLYLLQKKR